MHHARAIGLLPGVVTVLVPALIVWRTEVTDLGWGLPLALAGVPWLAGTGLISIGLTLTR